MENMTMVAMIAAARPSASVRVDSKLFYDDQKNVHKIVHNIIMIITQTYYIALTIWFMSCIVL